VAEDVKTALGRRRCDAEVPAFGATRGDNSGTPWHPPVRLETRLRAAVGRGLGVVREVITMRETLSSLELLSSEATAGEARNMVLVGRLVAAAAILREESRGAHRRRDFPETDASCTHRSARTADELLLATAAV
jgi:L-aspartate oxidase